MAADLNPQDHRDASRRAPTEDEIWARKRRNLAVGLALAGFALLIFLVSMERLQSNIAAGAGG